MTCNAPAPSPYFTDQVAAACPPRVTVYTAGAPVTPPTETYTHNVFGCLPAQNLGTDPGCFAEAMPSPPNDWVRFRNVVVKSRQRSASRTGTAGRLARAGRATASFRNVAGQETTADESIISATSSGAPLETRCVPSDATRMTKSYFGDSILPDQRRVGPQLQEARVIWGDIEPVPVDRCGGGHGVAPLFRAVEVLFSLRLRMGSPVVPDVGACGPTPYGGFQYYKPGEALRFEDFPAYRRATQERAVSRQWSRRAKARSSTCTRESCTTRRSEGRASPRTYSGTGASSACRTAPLSTISPQPSVTRSAPLGCIRPRPTAGARRPWPGRIFCRPNRAGAPCCESLLVSTADPFTRATMCQVRSPARSPHSRPVSGSRLRRRRPRRSRDALLAPPAHGSLTPRPNGVARSLPGEGVPRDSRAARRVAPCRRSTQRCRTSAVQSRSSIQRSGHGALVRSHGRYLHEHRHLHQLRRSHLRFTRYPQRRQKRLRPRPPSTVGFGLAPP